MRLITPLDSWTKRLFVALAISPALAACGSSVVVGGSGGSGAAGGAGGSGGSGAGTTGGGGVASPFPCENPMPYPGLGEDPNGYQSCEGGMIHHYASGTCVNNLQNHVPPSCNDPTFDECTTDADCTAAPYGFCSWPGEAVPGCWCNYGCVTSADCAEGYACLCGEPIGVCVPATCDGDGDCDPGMLCSSYTQDPGCGGTAFSCQTPADDCGGDADCAPNQLCSIDFATGAHVCQDINCAIGRPFTVDAELRTAPAEARRDWLERGLRPDVALVPEAHRAEVIDYWHEVAAMEHASVASFARFVLELLAAGAPPELLHAASRAMDDETRHAKAAYALASAYAGRAVGPGPLDVSGSMARTSLEDMVRAAVREGCAGESAAAVEAYEASAMAVDPAVRGALATIAEDEEEHAELAFRFVRWALGRDRALEAVVRDEIARLEAEVRVGEAPAGCRRLLSWGVVRPSVRVAIRAEVVVRVVLPALRALVEQEALLAA